MKGGYPLAAKPVVGVEIKAKINDKDLEKSGAQVAASSAKVGQRAADAFQTEFHKRAGLDPAKLANPAQFGQHGQKAGRAMGDSAADAMRRGDWAGAAKDSARTFEMTFERAAKPRASVDTSAMQREGGSAGDSFASGFGSAAGLAKLAGKGGPIAGAIIAGVAAAVKVVGPMVQDAMKVDADIAMSQARGGMSNSQIAEIRKAATEAWGRNSGASIQDNVSAAVTAFQSGLPGNQQTIEELNNISAILGEEIPAVARSAGQLIRTGLAGNASQAFDIIAAGQREGLNVSQDWLDTLNEYSTQFRKLGLTGADAVGLMKQMLQAGARDTDIAADALKEFSIRAIDGSKATTDAYTALGLKAADMATKISTGGDTARVAFDQVIDRIRAVKDPVQQMQIAVALMGTQAEDLGDAFKSIDLTTAADSIKDVEGAAQNAADTALRTSQNEWAQAGRNIQKIWQDVKDSLNMGDWFSQIPKSFNEWMTPPPRLTPGAPGVPGQLAPGPGPAIAPPPGLPGGNPLDIFAPRGGTAAPGAPAAPTPGPAPGMWWGPNMTRPVENPRFGSQYTRDDSRSGGASGPTGPVVPFTGDPMSLLQGHPVNSSTYSAAQAKLDADHKVQQAEASLNALRSSNVATADQIVKQQNELQAAQSDQLQAQMRFTEAMTTAATGMTDGMESISSNFADIGAGLDADLGFSKGLPGLADNLVRFIGALATAPLQAMLSKIANPGGNTAQSAPQGYAQPAFGGYPGDAALLSRIPAGTYTQENRGDLTQGLADCSSAVEDLVNMLDGRSTAGASWNTGNMAQKLAERGFLPGAGGPGDMRIGLSPSHTQATLPGGTNFNWGSQAAADLGGRQGGGAAAMPQQFFRPVGPSPLMPTATPSSPRAPQTGGLSIPTPMSSAALNANPGLTNPGLSPALPAPGSFPGGGGPMANGMPQAFTPSYTPGTPSEQAAPSWSPQGGGQLGSGFLGMAMGLASGAAGMGANMFAPGSGAAAQAAADMAQKAIQRTIAFGGQAAGIGMQGIMETFGVSDPDGGGSSGGSSWLTRIAGGLAGAKPATGIGAGKADKESRVDPNAPQNQGPQGQQQPAGGPTVSIGQFVQAENRNGQQVVNDLASAAHNAHINPGG